MGHTGGAAGILEAIITIIGMNNDFVPTTLHASKPRRLIPDKIVFDPKPIPFTYQNAISCNSGFGGSNAMVLISKKTKTAWDLSSITNIPIVGTGSVSCFGIDCFSDGLSGQQLDIQKLNSNQYPLPKL